MASGDVPLGHVKNDISPSQLHRTLGVTFHTAQFTCHRIREAKSEHMFDLLRGEGGSIAADETYLDNAETSSATLPTDLTGI